MSKLQDKDKEKSLKAQEKKHHAFTYKKTPKRLMSDFSSETMEDRIQWNNTVKMLGRNCQPSILYPAKLPFRKSKDKGKSTPGMTVWGTLTTCS